MVLLAQGLLHQNPNYQVYLTSWNLIARNRGLELWNIAPDYILFNYIRVNNENLIKSAQSFGIKTGVLDNEGGIVDLETLNSDFLGRNEETRNNITHFFTWGTVLASEFKKNKYFPEKSLYVTGTPRYDFYTAPYNQIGNKPQKEFKKYILFNSNFPMANPQFQTVEQEVEMLVKKFGFIEEEMWNAVAITKAGLTKMIELVIHLSVNFKNINFIYRPHPFEKLETYQHHFKDYPNIFLKQEGTVDQWILGAKAVVQRSCSTAIESAISKIPSFSPRFVPTCSEYLVAEQVSDPCYSFEELQKKITAVLEGKYSPPREILNNLKINIPKWFYKIDGKAHERIAKIISNTKYSSSRKLLKKSCTNEIRKIKVIEFLKETFRLLPFNSFIRKLGPSVKDLSWWDNSKKYFGVKEVQAISNQISQINPEFKCISVNQVDGDYFRSILLIKNKR